MDMLSELITHPGWRTFRRQLDSYLQGKYNQLLTPSDSEFDMVRKEATTAVIHSHKQFLAFVEDQVERYNRTVKRKT